MEPSEVDLVTQMGLLEAKAFVETMGIVPAAIGGELYDRAAARAALVDSPVDHPLTEPSALTVPCHAHGFDLAPQCAFTGKPGDEGQLQRTDHATSFGHDCQQLVGVGVDRRECRQIVLGQGFTGIFAAAAQQVVGQHRDDRGDVTLLSATEGNIDHAGFLRVPPPQ